MLRASLNIASALIRHAGLRGIRNSLAVNELMAEKHPTEPHYYLFAIAARPRFQGSGCELMRASTLPCNMAARILTIAAFA